MRKRYLIELGVVLGLSALLLVVKLPLGGAQALQLAARYLNVPSFSLMNFDSADWNKVPALEVPLVSQVVYNPGPPVQLVSPVSPGEKVQTTVKSIKVKAVHNGRRLFFYLEWRDRTRDADFSGPKKFSDGVAIQFPLVSNGQPVSLCMGQKGAYVNIWHWRPDLPKPESMVAGGPFFLGGTTTAATPIWNTEAIYKWARGSWRVIISRPLITGVADQAQFTQGSLVPVAFAVWDGSNKERGGKKSASSWFKMAIASPQ
jgi:complex iron-sulfur molybdoenzyme family reductase subunit gamma